MYLLVEKIEESGERSAYLAPGPGSARILRLTSSTNLWVSISTYITTLKGTIQQDVTGVG